MKCESKCSAYSSLLTILALVVTVSAQQAQPESIEDLKTAIQKLETIDKNPATPANIKEINCGFLTEKRVKVVRLLGKKKQSTREYLSTAMSTLSTDQITRVEQQISDLDVQIKRFQSASPDNQADVSGGADTNSVSTPAESISGGTRDDPTSSALSKASNGTSVDASTRTRQLR